MEDSPPPPRFMVTDAQIDAVIDEFYDVVRSHPSLGPVFAAHVHDWPAHEAKITRFWKNAIRHERVYDGNPMAVHKAAGNVRPGMFMVWLALFDRVLARNLPDEVAQSWSALAHRIGHSLMMGLMRFDDTGPPRLR
jgi:hemoglobin